MIRIADVPRAWLAKNTVRYPPHQNLNPLIEERAFSYFTSQQIDCPSIYIPIQWTQTHCRHNWGNDKANIAEMQAWCNQLTSQYPNETFFTVVQFDGGTLASIDNCRIFASSGDFNSPIGKNSKYEPIPLLCNPHDGSPSPIKKYKAGYVGSETHPLRREMVARLNGLPGYALSISHQQKSTDLFRDILYQSIFALAPRGYGPASFRMYEAIQMQCIPIYISDEFWLPFQDRIDWRRMCLLIKPEQIASIPQRIDTLLETGQYKDYLAYGQEIYQQHLTWDGCLNTMATMLRTRGEASD